MAEHDAELLLRHCLGWDRARLLVERDTTLPSSRVATYEDMLARRARRVPLQHITGVQEFFGRAYRVSAEVLIPRPETEILVEATLRHLEDRVAPRVADIGTGSGCIAITIAACRSDARVSATDLSPGALDLARKNAATLGVAQRISFLEGDLLEALPAALGKMDAVVSNPPYVDAAQRASLMPEVRDHEPALALFPPGEVLSVYRRLAPSARARLVRNGLLLVEVGQGQANAVADIATASGLCVEEIMPDLRGIPRVVVARAR